MQTARIVIVLLVVGLVFVGSKCLRGSVDIRPEGAESVSLYERENPRRTGYFTPDQHDFFLQAQFIERRYSDLECGISCLGAKSNAL